ncbi:hypothetical protein CEP49_04635 [Mergibacter septicus]|uniref:LysM-like peptidoglycan-binding domain-containing protein n=1 Tax=Mergibacter septicus TaxID=221402 RepID=UPI0011791336|nr:LysM-like peptidoglycan-binding domain-containing protein [Mergibacter septicus]AWX13892.1 hypothetical protein CEP49_04635 [Mergibacter septicus]
MNRNEEQHLEPDQNDNMKKDPPQQNELNLDFSEMEPITPKKTVEPNVGLINSLQLWYHRQSQKWQQAMLSKKSKKTQATTTETTAETLASEQTETAPINTLETHQKSKFFAILPIKHRRLAITLSGLIVILLIFFWLKPEQSPVDSLQHGNVTITYQPLDQNNSADNTDIPWLAQSTENISAFTPTENTSIDQNITPLPNTTIEQNSDGYTIIRENSNQVQNEVIENIKNEQAEAARALAILNGGTIPENQQIASVEPTTIAQTVSNGQTDNTTINYKTLVISSGKSLMQVFRDNHLNISDIIAMNKTKGAKMLSHFKPGDKVQVNVKHGRVTELRLSDGSRFIRNTDGSYQYQK